MSAAKASRTRRGQVREAVVRTSRSLIAESGVEALSVAEVARRLGVSTAAPYRHFPDRAVLLSAVLADVASDLVDAVTAAAASAPDPEDAFLLAVDAYARHVVATRVGLPDLFGARARGLPGDALAEARGRLVDELIAAVSTRGTRNRDAAARIAQDVLAAVSGLVTAYLAGALEPGTDLESVAARAVELARAMAPRPRRRPASAAPSVDAPTSVVDDDQPALF